MPDLSQPAWAAFFEACQELQLPVNFHIGSSQREMDFYGKTPWPSLGNEARLALGSANLFLGNARVIGNLIYAGVAERYPGCRFVSVESGVGWVPFYLDARVAREAGYVWAALSDACHYHAYELAPTAGELTGWIDAVAGLTQCMNQTGPGSVIDSDTDQNQEGRDEGDH